MAGTPDKGKFSTGIGQDVIEEALRAVEKRTDGDDAEAGAPVDLAPEGERLPVESAAPEAEAPAEPAPSADVVQKELEELKIQLEFSQSKGRELMEKIKDTHDKMLRAVADLENFKRRAQKEKEEVQKFGVERLLKDLLPIPDNLDRALEHARTQSDFDSLKKGLQMTRKLFEDTLGRHGVKSFSAQGQAFDPRLHEAMQHVETAEMAPGMVAQEVLRGYTLNDRLVRPALVMVSKAPEAGAAEPPAPAPEPPSSS
ncbi:MAG TPA: nucleotide exchange factor GrpE [Myxococcaceae bacterium]|nr:nucleotide exchange factor GrpE [Myxococcaceae bacterium]